MSARATVSRSELERALRAADAPEDSMATEDDLIRYEGRAEAVAIMRDMLGSSVPCVAGWHGPWSEGVCVDCGAPRESNKAYSQCVIGTDGDCTRWSHDHKRSETQ